MTDNYTFDIVNEFVHVSSTVFNKRIQFEVQTLNHSWVAETFLVRKNVCYKSFFILCSFIWRQIMVAVYIGSGLFERNNFCKMCEYALAIIFVFEPITNFICCPTTLKLSIVFKSNCFICSVISSKWKMFLKMDLLILIWYSKLFLIVW